MKFFWPIHEFILASTVTITWKGTHLWVLMYSGLYCASPVVEGDITYLCVWTLWRFFSCLLHMCIKSASYQQHRHLDQVSTSVPCDVNGDNTKKTVCIWFVCDYSIDLSADAAIACSDNSILVYYYTCKPLMYCRPIAILLNCGYNKKFIMCTNWLKIVVYVISVIVWRWAEDWVIQLVRYGE